MPDRGRLARGRRRYTGETPEMARRGISRDGTHGLDTCTLGQFDLRALLFYFAFTPGPRNISRMLCYDWDASAQYDIFVMANAGAADNLACSFGPKRTGRPQLPGLRILPHGPNGYEFVHLPTGGRMMVTGTGPGWYRKIADETARGPLEAEEITALGEVSPMSHDTKRLFAALMARSSCRSRDGRWSIGQFLYADDEDFPDLPGNCWGCGFDLRGAGDSWELTWDRALAPETLLRPLVTPGIALADVGVSIEEASVASTIRLGSAELCLRATSGIPAAVR
ncbi:hypothetical protein [Kribbella catacumbae]|uniref:hypothetical protein n=1 Tax=Kribbella catacumbae TaxID=460086 RepID=UPI0003A4209C|nr:hypothetical protein [Kribbella catacumbae]